MNDRLAALYPQHLETLKQRHDAALRESGFDSLVIFAGELRVSFLDDRTYPFWTNPHFKSWVPVVDNPHCFLVYTPGDKPRLVFYQPVDYWYKPPATPTAPWTEHFDIRIITNPEDAKQYFPTNGRVAFIGEGVESFGGESNPEALLNRLHFERARKTEYEIECIRQANVKGARGHVAAERAFREGRSEYEIHFAYLQASDQTEDEIPYSNIVALNENAAVLHYINHERQKLADDQRHSFLIDAGAQVNGYASDITRTYSRNGEFGELIAAMDSMQQGLCDAVKPGVKYPDIHMMAHRGVASILSDFGFVALDADAIVDSGISRSFFPHGVGHYLGLQVHDVAGFMADHAGTLIPKPQDHPYLRLTRPIEPQQVFTIEPGLYFIEPLLSELKKSDNARHVKWDKVDSFRKYGGIRIEDDIVVTAGGHENLTRDAFKELGASSSRG
jgi:Xaa-Pro dipeptidase